MAVALTQEAWAAEKLQLEQRAEALAEQLEQARQQMGNSTLALTEAGEVDAREDVQPEADAPAKQLEWGHQGPPAHEAEPEEATGSGNLSMDCHVQQLDAPQDALTRQLAAAAEHSEGQCDLLAKYRELQKVYGDQALRLRELDGEAEDRLTSEKLRHEEEVSALQTELDSERETTAKEICSLNTSAENLSSSLEQERDSHAATREQLEGTQSQVAALEAELADVRAKLGRLLLKAGSAADERAAADSGGKAAAARAVAEEEDGISAAVRAALEKQRKALEVVRAEGLQKAVEEACAEQESEHAGVAQAASEAAQKKPQTLAAAHKSALQSAVADATEAAAKATEQERLVAEAAQKDAVSKAIEEALQRAQADMALAQEEQTAKAVQEALAEERARQEAAREEAVSAAVLEALQSAESKAVAEREAQLSQAVSEAVAAEKDKLDDLAAELAVTQAELARASAAETFAEAPTPLPNIKTGGVSYKSPPCAVPNMTTFLYIAERIALHWTDMYSCSTCFISV